MIIHKPPSPLERARHQAVHSNVAPAAVKCKDRNVCRLHWQFACLFVENVMQFNNQGLASQMCKYYYRRGLTLEVIGWWKRKTDRSVKYSGGRLEAKVFCGCFYVLSIMQPKNRLSCHQENLRELLHNGIQIFRWGGNK